MDRLGEDSVERHLCPFAISSFLVHGERALKLLGLLLPPIPKALSLRPHFQHPLPKAELSLVLGAEGWGRGEMDGEDPAGHLGVWGFVTQDKTSP